MKGNYRDKEVFVKANETFVMGNKSFVRTRPRCQHFPEFTSNLKKNHHTLPSKYNSACSLYGCETWSPLFREERRLSIFENRVLRKMCVLGETK